MSDDVFVVCLRMDAQHPQPHAPSTLEKCDTCSHPIWVSHAIRKDEPTARFICAPCTPKDAQFQGPGPAVAAAVLHALKDPYRKRQH